MVKFALKNLARNKRHTIITVIMIAIGVLATIFVGGFLGAISQDLKRAVIESETGHIQAMAKGYKDNQGDLDYTIKNVSRLMEELEKETEIQAVIAQIAVSGLISSGNKSMYCWGTAVDPGEVNKVLPLMLEDFHSDNGYLSLDIVDGVILGQGLAAKLEAGIGTPLFMVSLDKYGSMSAVNLTVTDITTYATEAENDSRIITTISNTADLYLLGDEATAVSMKVRDPRKIDEFVAEFNNKYGDQYGVQFYSWEEFMGLYAQTIGMFDSVQLFILLILAFIVMTGVINTILMSVFERTNEIGTLMALGSSKKRIIFLFLVESFWVGAIGGLIGTVLGVFAVSLASINGIPFTAPGTSDTFYIKPILTTSIVFTPPIFLIVVSILAGIYPARMAASLDPVEAIRRA